MFAAIKGLNGHQLDKRDAENKRTFHEILNLTVGENSNRKSCYKNDIVYDHVNDF